MKRSQTGNGSPSELSLKNEIVGILLVFLGLFLFFSLISYSAFDPSFFHSTLRRPIFNYGGRMGAELSAFFFTLFGYVSFVFIAVVLFYAAFFLYNRRVKNIISKTLGFLLLIVFGSAFLASVNPLGRINQGEIRSGGMVGYLINEVMVGAVKRPFAAALSLLIMTIAVVLVTKISLRKVFVFVFHAVGRLFKVTARFFAFQFERFRERRRRKRIEEKYAEIPGLEIKAKIKPLRGEVEGPLGKREKVKEPSKIPEETYLFSDFDKQVSRKDIYRPPPLTYLDAPSEKSKIDISELEEKKQELIDRLNEFNISGKIVEYTPGPVITTFEFVPDMGVKVKDVASLNEDLALAVRAQYVRVERILGKKAIGIEIPNKKREIIHLRELLEFPLYQNATSPLTMALGKTTSGDIYISDLREMPHLLVAGATGSGKSIAIHTLILSILFKSSPRQVKFILIDPKRIELAIYNSLPHLLTPVVVNPKLAKNALDWAVEEMESRYKKLALLQVRGIEHYNRKLEMMVQSEEDGIESLTDRDPLPYVVIVIDELADLLLDSQREIEENIAKLAQKARAIGIHLILATQRPSVDVITGTIKNNFPSRIALAVPSKHDSRTIIDQVGAERLLGNGDMLFLPPKTATLIRLHCSFVSEEEAIRVVHYLAKKEKPVYDTQIIKPSQRKEELNERDELDELFFEAAEMIIASGQASASFLQRRMSVGYARAGRLMDQLEQRRVVSPANHKNQREILMTFEQLSGMRHPTSATPDGDDQIF